MIISLIVAKAENNVIGKEGGIPWRISADMKYFKETTMGKPIIMGRKTWKSLGKPLPGRQNIVISRTIFIANDEVAVVPDFASAHLLASKREPMEIMIIGGGAVYAEALPMADRIYLTEVVGEIEGDAYFPELDMTEWKEVSRTEVPRDEKASHDCAFVVLERA
jgi:dihydrofolate reductase